MSEFPRDPMVDHLLDAHGVTEERMQLIWEKHSRTAAPDWGAMLDASHDFLHAIAGGEVARQA